MPYLPAFIAPTRYTDPAAALAQVRAIYDQQIAHLRSAMQRYVAGETLPGHVRACYPFVRIHTETVARAILETPDIEQLSYGFVAGPGHFETTLTRPDLYSDYYLEQFRLLMQNHEVELEVGTSTQPIPIHFSFAENDHIEGTMSAARRMLMRDVFDLPDLAAMDDGIANGTYEAQPGEPQPLSLFTAARVDYSLQRLRHYTGTSPHWFQNFVLFTNYQFYIDEFVRLGHRGNGQPGQRIHRLHRAGQRRDAARRPAGAKRRRAGRGAAAPAADAGLPPGARRPQRHHHGQHRRRPGQCQEHHRPCRRAAPARLDHARPLRRPAQQPAAGRLRAGPRLCARRPCARRRAAAVGADSGAGRDPEGAGAGGGRRDAGRRA